MDKNAIKKYAVWARRELISRVSQRALLYGISEKDCGDMFADTVNGHLLTASEKKQRQSLIAKIKKDGYQQAMEAAAYTWFNRFCALRFMEVNGYLPSHVRVFTDEQNAFKPQILAEAIHLEIDGLNMEKVYELKDANKTDELYKYLLIVQCNALGNLLPGMFTRIEDYTELLFPDNLLREGSVIEQMIALIPQKDWDISTLDENGKPQGQVQIIGWLYQYYNAEPKDKVFENLKKNIKISKENIPAATQLFTPDWIVRYMVENSLGRIAVSGFLADSGQPLAVSHKERELARIEREKEIAERFGWKYYLPEAEQEESVRAELTANSYQLTADQLLSLKVIDPCMGSGHILVYMFDVLVQIYEAYGYNTREAAGLILQNNLYGLDIDDRAAQLAYFAVMMKARQYDRRIFSRGIQPHVYAIVESNGISRDVVDYFEDGRADLKKALETIITELHDAKEYGSILNVTQVDFAALYARLEEIKEDISMFALPAQTELRPLIEVAETMAQKYHTVVTNPPYMGSNGMSPKLTKYVKENYPNSKADLFSCFIEHGISMTKKQSFTSMITMESWMFLSSFEKMRSGILNNSSLYSMIHMPYLGKGGTSLGINFGTAAFVISNVHIAKYRSQYDYICYFDLDSNGVPTQYPTHCSRNTTAVADSYSLVPGAPIAYWLSNATLRLFNDAPSFGSIAAARSGLSTTDNNRFLRFWYEILFDSIGFNYSKLDDTADCRYRFIPHQKGGEYRKWYGNLEYVVDWYNNGASIKKAAEGASGGRIVGSEYYLQEGLTWTDLTSTGKISVRFAKAGSIFNSSGPMCFCFDKGNQYYVLAFMNSIVANNFLRLLAPTFHFNGGPISKLPLLSSESYYEDIARMANESVVISSTDWDSFETSWDFKRHPLVSGQWTVDSDQNANHCSLITDHYKRWESECDQRFSQLKANEEELNRIFIDIYGLQDELTPEVEDKDVTVRKADLGRDIRSFISYAVGCMFGRYSLNTEGLAYAGGEISEQWVVVSGQLINRRVVEYYVGKELSRAFGMAEIHGVGNGNIQFGKAAAERGTVFTFGSNAEGCGFNSVQYRRGTTKKLYEGICELSLNCKGIQCGIADAIYDLCSPEILNAISSGNSAELVGRGWKDADSIDWKAVHYSLTTNHYTPGKDNIIPICDDEYFDDDIVGRFVEFVKVVYGEDTLEENLQFIANALTANSHQLSARQVIRSYFLNDFYADHLKIYQKRPIYWLFDSGKKGGFKALIYMHRYQPDTIARIRTDYVHEQQARYRTAIADLQNRITSASTSERVKLNKQLQKLQAQADEIHAYEEKIHHLADQMIRIDLDDGVKHNYELFADVLAIIK